MRISYEEAVQALQTCVDLIPAGPDDPNRSLAALREADAAITQALFAVGALLSARRSDRELTKFVDGAGTVNARQLGSTPRPSTKLNLDDLELDL